MRSFGEASLELSQPQVVSSPFKTPVPAGEVHELVKTHSECCLAPKSDAKLPEISSKTTTACLLKP